MVKEISIEDISAEMLRELWTSGQIPVNRYVEELERRGLRSDLDRTKIASQSFGWRLVPIEPDRAWFEKAFPAAAHIRNDPGARRAYDATIDLRMDEYRLLLKVAPKPKSE